jgi:pyruvate/oxaloacetate carboxyltransferase
MADGPLNDFLGKFKALFLAHGLDKERVVKAIHKVTNLEIPMEQIAIKKGIIRFAVSPAIKSKLFTKKSEILEQFKKEKIEVRTILW